jgi:hypothetical protein
LGIPVERFEKQFLEKPLVDIAVDISKNKNPSIPLMLAFSCFPKFQHTQLL